MSIKLKDYKKDPAQYKEILTMCKNCGITPNDEDDVFELFKKIQNAEIEHVKNIAEKAIKNFSA